MTEIKALDAMWIQQKGEGKDRQQSENSHRLADPQTHGSIATGLPRPGQNEAIHSTKEVQNGKQPQSCSLTGKMTFVEPIPPKPHYSKTNMRQDLSSKKAWRSCCGSNLPFSRRSVSGEDQLRHWYWFIRRGHSQRDNTQACRCDRTSRDVPPSQPLVLRGLHDQKSL